MILVFKKAEKMSKDFYDKIRVVTYENISKDTLRIYKELSWIFEIKTAQAREDTSGLVSEKFIY